MKDKKIEKLVKQLPQILNKIQMESAELNEDQLSTLIQKKDQYLQTNDPNNAEEILERNLAVINSETFHTYLNAISECYVPIQKTPMEKSMYANRIRHFDITKWVTDTTENSIEKLTNVYQVFTAEDCSVALIFFRGKNSCRVTFAVASNQLSQDVAIANGLTKRIQNALYGNFPGTQCSEIKCDGLSFFDNENLTIAAISNLATEKSEKFISQSIEKLIDGIVPTCDEEEYCIVLLAEPVKDCTPVIQRLQSQYTAISPFAQVQRQFSLMETTTVTASANVGANVGKSNGWNIGGHIGGSIGVGVPAIIPGIPLPVTVSGGGNAGVHFGYNSNKSIGGQAGRSEGYSEAVGSTSGNTQTYTNYAVKHTMDMLEKQMERIEQCKTLGMWNFAAYVISPDHVVAKNVAHTYRSLTQGTNSYLAQSAINLWRYNSTVNDDNSTINYITSSLAVLKHPLFQLKESKNETPLYPLIANATTLISSNELARSMNFPRKSIPGLPVIQCAAFGRNVIPKDNAYKGDIDIGCISHMQKEEPSNKVQLDSKNLTMHTFITGSTGSGKSNTIYQILDQLHSHDAKFLVIEPAKGEYRNVFGGRDDVSVYGTNPKLTALLRINPFSFPEEIHIYEHMDRLVEIFNVCWPMYAAMPAVLKDAIERAYQDAGWDLRQSVNKYDSRLFPTFCDILRQIDIVMNESQYSADSKGDYKGALATRLRSLTNGINGMIFSADELSAEELFDNNVIVDLSRVGSMETKSLIMGLLVMKLQEHRMAHASMNENLKHITVLEEAHNLLKRTSTEQSNESANLVGKSVEMLTNAIAEMRTYGEGFIIADQSPGLLDMSVIRNTNTKIIMRLPDLSDRELVGKAAGLNDDQIVELGKLELGVASITQSGWLEPVLCKVDHLNISHPYTHTASINDDNIREKVIQYILSDISKEKPDSNVEYLTDRVILSNLPVSLRYNLLHILKHNRPTQLSQVYCLIADCIEDSEDIFKKSSKATNMEEWTQMLLSNLRLNLSMTCQMNIIECLIYARSKQSENMKENFNKWMNYMGRNII